MSRAFVKEEDFEPPPPVWPLPPRDEPGFDAAAAHALLEAARIGETSSAEVATGYAWGEPRLRALIEELRLRAIDNGDDRLEQVAERYLRSAARTAPGAP